MTEPERTDTRPIPGLPLKDGGRAPHRDGLTADQVRHLLHREDRRHDAHDKGQTGRCAYCDTCGARLGPSSVVSPTRSPGEPSSPA